MSKCKKVAPAAVTNWRLETRNRMQTLKACFTEINQSATMGKQGRDHRTGEQHILLITNNYTQRQRKKPKAYIGAQ